MAEDRAVLHQPVVEEDLLALADVRRRVEHLPRGIDDALRASAAWPCRSGRPAARARRSRTAPPARRPAPSPSTPATAAARTSAPRSSPRPRPSTPAGGCLPELAAFSLPTGKKNVERDGSSRPRPDDDVLALPVRARLVRARSASCAARRPRRSSPRASDATPTPCGPSSSASPTPACSSAAVRPAARPAAPRVGDRAATRGRPGGRPRPTAARAAGSRARPGRRRFASIERAGREIGRELAPDPGARGTGSPCRTRSPRWASRRGRSRPAPTGCASCSPTARTATPSARTSPPSAACTGAHRGTARPPRPRRAARGFVAKDPYAAGCLIELDGVAVGRLTERHAARPMTLAALRSQFPILERVAYLNAGTDGPVPRAAQEAVARELAVRGRGRPRVRALRAPARAARRAPRRLRRAARLPGRRPGADHLDQRGHGQDPGGDGPRAGRRDHHLRRRAPGPARAAAGGQAARRERARGAVRPARRRGQPEHHRGRLLARQLAHRRAGTRGARRRRRARDPRRRPGRRRDPGRRREAPLRRLRRRRPEVAVRRRRHRDALRRPGVPRARARDRARLHRASPTPRSASSRSSRPMPAATTPPRSRARWWRSASPRSASCAAPGWPTCWPPARRWPPGSPSGSRPTAGRSRRGATPRSSRSRTPTRSRRATACASRASSCATSRARGSSAPGGRVVERGRPRGVLPEHGAAAVHGHYRAETKDASGDSRCAITAATSSAAPARPTGAAGAAPAPPRGAIRPVAIEPSATALARIPRGP